MSHAATFVAMTQLGPTSAPSARKRTSNTDAGTSGD